MKKYIIYAPHKCGSSILFRIIRDVFDIPSSLMSQEIIIDNDSGKAKIQVERFIRIDNPEPLVDFNKDNFIFVPRNPIGITMSMYYSFGYTHNCPKHLTQEQFKLTQQQIRELGISGYVNKEIWAQTNKIKEFWDVPTTNKKIILPYELMIRNFSKFLKEFLQTLDVTSKYDKIYEKWKKSFEEIEDKSNLIESGKVKSHKRTTDIYEWKKKLNNEEQIKILKQFPFIQQYDDFLTKIL